MNRRSFLKSAGLFVVGSLGVFSKLLATEPPVVAYKKIKKLDLTFEGYPSIKPEELKQSGQPHRVAVAIALEEARNSGAKIPKKK